MAIRSRLCPHPHLWWKIVVRKSVSQSLLISVRLTRGSVLDEGQMDVDLVSSAGSFTLYSLKTLFPADVLVSHICLHDLCPPISTQTTVTLIPPCSSSSPRVVTTKLSLLLSLSGGAQMSDPPASPSLSNTPFANLSLLSLTASYSSNSSSPLSPKLSTLTYSFLSITFTLAVSLMQPPFRWTSQWIQTRPLIAHLRHYRQRNHIAFLENNVRQITSIFCSLMKQAERSISLRLSLQVPTASTAPSIAKPSILNHAPNPNLIGANTCCLMPNPRQRRRPHHCPYLNRHWRQRRR